MKRDEVRSRLDKLGVKPSRRLGQNFLLDESAAESLVSELDPGQAGTVIEVGPGLGVLTHYLAERSRKLILLEKDARLAAGLREQFAGQDHVEIVEGDALDYDLRPLFADGPVRFIGNLPYSCGGAIIRRFLTPPTPVERAVVTLQKEVVDRLCAEPRTKAYGVLTLRVQAYWEPKVLRTIPPEVFYPRPGIDSASLLLTPRPAEQLQPFDARGFDRLIRQGFSQRRKQLKKLLAVVGCDWEKSSAQFDWSPTARAEELSLEDWVRLSREVDDHPLKDIPQKDDEVFDVVDENDEVVRQATRKEVHADDLLHRAVHLFVFNKHGELFLQKRSRLKDTHPGAWDSSAAGHLDAGEGYETSAVRELGEELGLEDCPVEEVARIAPSERTGWEFVRLYRARANGPVRYPASEIETGAFFPLSVVRDWAANHPGDFATGFLECLKAFPDSMLFSGDSG